MGKQTLTVLAVIVMIVILVALVVVWLTKQLTTILGLLASSLASSLVLLFVLALASSGITITRKRLRTLKRPKCRRNKSKTNLWETIESNLLL